MPLWPYCLNVRLEGISVLVAVPMAVIGRAERLRHWLAASLSSSGLGSKRSTWLGPPSMNSQMTDLAVGVMVRLLGRQRIGGVWPPRIRPRPASLPARCRQAAAGAGEEFAAGARNVLMCQCS